MTPLKLCSPRFSGFPGSPLHAARTPSRTESNDRQEGLSVAGFECERRSDWKERESAALLDVVSSEDVSVESNLNIRDRLAEIE